jgi:hypothetical protein
MATYSIRWLLQATAAFVLVALLVAAATLHEYSLLAIAAVAAQRLFFLDMDRKAPWDSFRAGARCMFASLIGLAVSAGLLMFVTVNLLGWLALKHPSPEVLPWSAVLAGAVIYFLHTDAANRRAESYFWLVVTVPATALIYLEPRQLDVLMCCFTAAIALWLGLSSWRLARDAAAMWR